MGKIKTFFLLFVVLFFSGTCFAKQIAIQIVQRSLTDTVSENALVIEDQLLNGLFNSGYIVTNSPTVTSPSESQDKLLWSDGLGDAYEGSADYFVQITLFSENPDVSRNYFTKVDWSVSKVKDGKEISHSSLKTKDAADYQKELKAISADLVLEIKKAVKA